HKCTSNSAGVIAGVIVSLVIGAVTASGIAFVWNKRITKLMSKITTGSNRECAALSEVTGDKTHTYETPLPVPYKANAEDSNYTALSPMTREAEPVYEIPRSKETQESQ
ncbi:uncharacterized protein LOC144351785, partial [Saccoglossus kowalevskii]